MTGANRLYHEKTWRENYLVKVPNYDFFVYVLTKVGYLGLDDRQVRIYDVEKPN